MVESHGRRYLVVFESGARFPFRIYRSDGERLYIKYSSIPPFFRKGKVELKKEEIEFIGGGFAVEKYRLVIEGGRRLALLSFPTRGMGARIFYALKAGEVEEREVYHAEVHWYIRRRKVAHWKEWSGVAVKAESFIAGRKISAGFEVRDARVREGNILVRGELEKLLLPLNIYQRFVTDYLK